MTGAALLLQSFGTARGVPYNPEQLRGLLSNAMLNTASANPAADQIGVMPNLRAIIEAEGGRIKRRYGRWALVAQILFGVIHDGGGVIWVPGKGPVPVDPWEPINVDQVSVEVRDMLVALAVHEFAGLSEDVTSVRAVRKASLAAVKRATERLAVKAEGR